MRSYGYFLHIDAISCKSSGRCYTPLVDMLI